LAEALADGAAAGVSVFLISCLSLSHTHTHTHTHTYISLKGTHLVRPGNRT